MKLRVADLAALPREVARELLRRAVRRATSGAALSAGQEAQLARLLASPESGRATLPGGQATVSCGWLLVEPAPAAGSGCGRLPGPRYSLSDGAWSGKAAGHPGPDDARASSELFDPTALDGPPVLRAWRPGDRLDIGSGRKKLKEIFREARVPAWERGRRPLVADRSGVLWAVGLRRSERARPRAGGPVIRVSVRWTASGATMEVADLGRDGAGARRAEESGARQPRPSTPAGSGIG